MTNMFKMDKNVANWLVTSNGKKGSSSKHFLTYSFAKIKMTLEVILHIYQQMIDLEVMYGKSIYLNTKTTG